MGTGVGVELHHRLANVLADGLRRDVETLGDVVVREPLGKQAQHVALALRQLRGLVPDERHRQRARQHRIDVGPTRGDHRDRPEQVVERLLGVLARGLDGASPLVGPPGGREAGGGDPLVLVANDISPADMLQWKGGVFLGFVTDVGGKTSHTAIVARSMDIPAVVGAREASRLIRQDDWLVIDGDSGTVIVDPPASVIDEYRAIKHEREASRAGLARLRHLPAVTLDGEAVAPAICPARTSSSRPIAPRLKQ